MKPVRIRNRWASRDYPQEMYMMRHIAFLVVVLLSVSVKSGSQHAASKTEILRSKWDATLETYGLTEETFYARKLYRMTPEDLKVVLLKAYATGFNIGQDFDAPKCGPIGKSDLSVAKVYVDTPDDTEAEITSGLRARMRSMPDVRVVFTQDEADLVVVILGIRNESTNSRLFGYTVAYVILRPCVVGSGKYSTGVLINLYEGVSAAGDLALTLDAVMARLDSKGIELARQWNANARKAEEAAKSK
jgi:hypothetical protein